MLSKTVLVGLIAAAIAAPMLLVPVMVSAVDDDLEAEFARIVRDASSGNIRGIVNAKDPIPTDGSAGAFGYGITAADANSILVITTHAGVLDSEDQNFILDPVFHTHLVTLDGSNPLCGSDPAVDNISWEAPGNVKINNHRVLLTRLPTGPLDLTNSITGEDLALQFGQDVNGVVTFSLHPIFTENGLQAVCVTDIAPLNPNRITIIDQ